jgi:hypothetical protein
MTTPMRPIPAEVERWLARRRWLRWGDALLAWALAWAGAVAVLDVERLEAAAVLALALVAGGAVLPALRVRWRPVSGWVGLQVSRGLRPGDRAWYLGADDATLVMITARRGGRLVVARPGFAPDEGISVRRTRVFVLAADARGPGAGRAARAT